MAKMNISEEALNRVISESISRVLSKALNEGFMNQAKQGFGQNAYSGVKNASNPGMQQGFRNGAKPQAQQAQQSQWTSTIAEETEEEGLFNRIGSAISGAKQGYQAQKSLDRGTGNFKQQHDYDDVRKSMDNPLSKMPKTAEEQAKHLYDQYKQYQQQANKLLNMYNKMCRQYGLQKQSVGQHTTPTPAPAGNGVNFNTPDAKNKFGRKTSGRDTSHLKNSWFEEEE